MTGQKFVRFVECAFLEDAPVEHRPFRGKLDTSTVKKLLLPTEYHQGAHGPHYKDRLKPLLALGSLGGPLVLAVRDTRVRKRPGGEILVSEAFVVDGWQRVTALKQMGDDPATYPAVPFQNVIVYLDTDVRFESGLFRERNTIGSGKRIRLKKLKQL
jgi:hypothetical protein